MKTIKTTYIRIASVLAVILIVIMIIYAAGQNRQDSAGAESSGTGENLLSSWTDSAQAKKDLTDYLAAISDEAVRVISRQKIV